MFKKLFFAVAFASAVLAQDFTVAVPVNKVQTGKSMTVLLQSTASASQDFGFAIGVSTCLGGCPKATSGLGNIIYTGSLFESGNITLDAPNWFNGEGVVNAAHFYISQDGNTAVVDIASTTIEVSGSSG
ncbi:hypothetical protein V8E55_010563 [Tylopilus felleus]